MVRCWYGKGGKKMEEPKLIYQKNADKQMNRIIIPKFFIDKHDREFYMEIYEGKIVLKPVKKGE
jgi:hypothetical protein